MSVLKWLDRIIEKFAAALLIAAVSGIFLFSLTGIVSRWLSLSPIWIDPLIRHLLFLSAFLAGILITGKSRHLAIDLLQKYFEHVPRVQRMLKRIVAAVSSLAALWLVTAGIAFLKSEMEFGREAFLGIHSAWWAGVIPVGFALMSYRFFYVFCLSFQKE